MASESESESEASDGVRDFVLRDHTPDEACPYETIIKFTTSTHRYSSKYARSFFFRKASWILNTKFQEIIFFLA